ncbi:MAG: hypothetical protein GY878_22665 [Fuerstiella sp.]|nr:hypothetical protein [Fuerstiella sp.]
MCNDSVFESQNVGDLPDYLDFVSDTQREVMRRPLGDPAFEEGPHVRLEEAAEPLVRRCRQQLGESILLAVLENAEVSTLIYLPSAQALRVHEPHAMGERAYGTAVGKVLLSTLDGPALDRYLQLFPPQRFTSATITDPDRLRHELAIIDAPTGNSGGERRKVP